MKVIDYLSEDPAVSGQKYALVSIVGPHLAQKCDTWGLKIKYVADTLERAKQMSAKLVKMDPEFDIYTVEVGKFFPLDVSPGDVTDIEYQNTQLNNLVKSYLENRQFANDQYQERKQKLMQDAIREGAKQEQKQEHPIAVLQRTMELQTKISQIKQDLETAESDLKANLEKYNSNYTPAERELAELEIAKATESASKNETERKETPKAPEKEDLFEQVQELDKKISEVTRRLNGTNPEHHPNAHAKLSNELEALNETRNSIKEQILNMVSSGSK